MKINHSHSFLAAAVVVAAALVVASPVDAQLQHRRGAAQLGPHCVGGIGDLMDQIEQTTLDDGEVADLVFLREEEKMARDVYLEFAEKWQLPIFTNIARAEQTHMDRVFNVIELYGIEDPIVDDTVGVFTDPSLDALFTEFVANGEISLIDALLAGAEIEDMDIADLYDMLENTNNDHIKLVAHNLAKGSRNHLRAFVRALTAQGATYVPQYLDPATFDAILAADMERRTVYNADGEPVPTCGGGWLGTQGQNRQGQREGHGQGEGHGEGSGQGSGHGPGDGECDGTGPDSDGGKGSGNGSGDCQN